VGRNEWQNVLKTWVRKLRQGGILRVAVPNFKAVVEWYTRTHRIQDILGLVCGGQKDVFDHHCMVFDEDILAQGMLVAGCVGVKHWDWRLTDHSDVDDYSQCYLPHMDKENGMLMSLNLEGVTAA
jgi:predicted SAM-dependent methyltransferase